MTGTVFTVRLGEESWSVVALDDRGRAKLACVDRAAAAPTGCFSPGVDPDQGRKPHSSRSGSDRRHHPPPRDARRGRHVLPGGGERARRSADPGRGRAPRIYATEILRKNPGAQLIAVEPFPAAREYFERNLRANGMLERVEYVQAGLSDRSGSGFLALVPESWEHSTVPPFSTNRVSIPLLSVLDVLRGRHPYLVKLNAEGAEFEVVPQMLEAGIRPRWIVLMIHPPNGPAEQLKELVARAGYEIIPADGQSDSMRLHCHLRT